MIDKRVLENILTDQAEELALKGKQHFCHRQEEARVDMESSQAQVVIGVRRSGKSTLCYNVLMHKGVKFAYVNFDDERLINLSGADLNDLLEVLYKVHGDFNYLFMDEIQNIPEWYLFVNRLLRRGMHILITGSNAKLLSGELATHLTGRHHTITLYPFSFSEYCDLKGVDTRSASTRAEAERRAAFDEYLHGGGFPELMHISNKRDYVSQLVDNILKRDVEQRFRVVYTTAFEELAQHLLNVAPTLLSDRSLQETFQLRSPHTAKNYVNYLQQAFLLLGLHRYSQKSRLRITGEKVYPVDVALMDGRENALAGENLGWRLEVVVYLELVRRYRPQGMDIYYYNEGRSECDFVICRGGRVVQAIQVSYDLTTEKTLKREVNGLVHVAEATGCPKLFLLTDHQREDLDHKGYKIEVRPVYEFTLTPEA